MYVCVGGGALDCDIVYSRGAPRLCAWSFGLGHISLYTAWMFPACVVLWTGTHHSIQPGCPPACVHGPLDWDTSLYTAGAPRACVHGPLDWDRSLYTARGGVWVCVGGGGVVVLWTETHHCIQPGCPLRHIIV